MLTVLINKGKNLQLLGLIFAISIFYFPTINGLFNRWILWDQALSHALPTLVVTGYLLWQAKFTPSKQDNNWIKAGLYICLAFSSLAWAGFQANNIEILSALALLFIIVIYTASCFSFVTSLKILPVLGLLTFTLPLLSQLNDLLILISSFVTGKLVAASNITALIEGNSISIPGGKIIIADGCSGLRYLTISILLGYIICLLNKSNWKQATCIMLASILIGLIANWLRIFILVLVGYQTDMQSSLMQDHETFGWILFTLIIGPALYLAPVNKSTEQYIPLPKIQFIIPSLILIIGPLLLFFSSHQPPKSNPLTLDRFNTAGIQSPSITPTTIDKSIQGKHETVVIELNSTRVYAGLITNTANNHEKLVPYIETPFNKEIWRTIDSITIQPHNFNYVVLKKVDGEQKRILAYSFQVGSNTTNKYYTAKLLQLKAKLFNEQYFGLITLESDCTDTCHQEAETISALAIDWNKSNQ